MILAYEKLKTTYYLSILIEFNTNNLKLLNANTLLKTSLQVKLCEDFGIGLKKEQKCMEDEATRLALLKQQEKKKRIQLKSRSTSLDFWDDFKQ